jgi:hypothetical protein
MCWCVPVIRGSSAAGWLVLAVLCCWLPVISSAGRATLPPWCPGLLQPASHCTGTPGPPLGNDSGGVRCRACTCCCRLMFEVAPRRIRMHLPGGAANSMLVSSLPDGERAAHQQIVSPSSAPVPARRGKGKQGEWLCMQRAEPVFQVSLRFSGVHLYSFFFRRPALALRHATWRIEHVLPCRRRPAPWPAACPSEAGGTTRTGK